MRPKRVNMKQKGFVLVVVLCTIIALAAFLLVFNRQCQANPRTVDKLQKSTKVLNYARAGLNIAIANIRDANDAFPNRNLFNRFREQKTFTLGDGECAITITEENGKLNLNLLKDNNGRLNQIRINQLLRLIDLLNSDQTRDHHIGYGLVPALIDWTDSDDEVTCLPFIKRENSGAESAYYNRLDVPYKCKNGPLDTNEELLLVRGISEPAFDRLHDYITVYGDGKISINHAPKLVIQSLSENMDPILAQMIINQRKLKPFGSIAELRDVPGMTDSIYYAIKKTATIEPKNRFYNVISQANFDDIGRIVTAILRRNMENKTVEVVLYKEL